MDLSPFSDKTHLHTSNSKLTLSYLCMSHSRTDMKLRLPLNRLSYHSGPQVNIDCWMRSRRDQRLPYRVLPFYHTNRRRCLMSLRWFVCRRMLRCTGRIWRRRCTIEWKWTASCISDSCHASDIPVGSTRTKTHPPPHHSDPCSSLLPRTLLCPKSAFDYSWTHNLCHPLL